MQQSLPEGKEVYAQKINSIFRAACEIENELIVLSNVLQDEVSHSFATRSNRELPGNSQAIVGRMRLEFVS